MRIQFPTTETGSSPLLIDSLWFESVPPGGTKIDPPDNTVSGSTPPPEPEEEDEEEEGSGTGS
jgi:hypothetical protein